MAGKTLAAAVARLARLATDDFTLDDMLTELCEAAGAALGVDHVGVMGSDGARNRFVSTDSPRVVPLEQLQEAMQQGPCHRAVMSGRPVVVPDLRAGGPADLDPGWADFAVLAEELGLCAVVAVPLVSRGRSWGTLDLYRSEPHAWSAAEVADAVLLADVAVSYLVMAADRDDAREAREELGRRSLHDALTGLPNRSFLFESLRHALATAERQGEALAVAFLDVDNFKPINDTYGHAAGDAVLVAVAERLDQIRRPGDLLARFAGDEFVLIAEHLPVRAPPPGLSSRWVTERVDAAMAEPLPLVGLDIRVTLSMGVVIITGQVTPEDLLHEADLAMYEAKQQGPGRVVVRDHRDEDTPLWAGRQLESDLPLAQERDELTVHYQPIQTAASGRTDAVEALLRWRHPQLGLITADRFVNLADRTGLLPGIGHQVIARACADLASWKSELGDRAPVTVWCNLTPRELVDPDLQDTIDTALTTAGLEPGNLGLEIVEADFADLTVLRRLQHLQARGHPLSVDDFGTGYSSLSRLIDLPVLVAKIDRTFVRGLPQDSRSRALVEAVLLVADGLALQVVAEGVETQAQKDYLVAAGCHHLQGHLIGRPMASEDLTRVLDDREHDPARHEVIDLHPQSRAHLRT